MASRIALARSTPPSWPAAEVPSPVTITHLGGVGEVGRNSTAIECEGRVIVIDYGLMFPDSSMPGVDVILPDDRYLREHADSIDGLIITHAHEDHVGGVPHFLRQFEAELYGSALTMGIAGHKVGEARLDERTWLHSVPDGDTVSIGPFRVEFLPITHSVPGSNCIVVHSPQGTIVHTGDFKLDPAPVDGRLTDLDRLRELSEGDGIRVLMADSTNADLPGSSASETEIGANLRELFPQWRGRRVIASCFASHVHRVQQIADIAIAEGRTLFPMGRSMLNYMRIARELGMLTIPERSIDSIENVDDYDDDDVCVLCTGSQGEPMAALALLARGDSQDLSVGAGDVVLLSSHPIPGNERSVFAVVNALVARGAEVVHSGQVQVHTSGHARRDELREFHGVVKPEWFVPIEGELRMLERHAELAVEVGLPADRAIIPSGGAQIVLDDDGVRLARRIPHRYRYVHGKGAELDEDVLDDRRKMTEGVVTAIVTVDADFREMVALPTVSSKGWATEDELSTLVPALETELAKAVGAALADKKVSQSTIERALKRTTGRFVSDRTRRRPPIVAVVQIAR